MNTDAWGCGAIDYHRGATREMLRIMRYHPTYGPMWRRVGETLRARLGRGR